MIFLNDESIIFAGYTGEDAIRDGCINQILPPNYLYYCWKTNTDNPLLGNVEDVFTATTYSSRVKKVLKDSVFVLKAYHSLFTINVKNEVRVQGDLKREIELEIRLQPLEIDGQSSDEARLDIRNILAAYLHVEGNVNTENIVVVTVGLIREKFEQLLKFGPTPAIFEDKAEKLEKISINDLTYIDDQLKGIGLKIKECYDRSELELKGPTYYINYIKKDIPPPPLFSRFIHVSSAREFLSIPEDSNASGNTFNYTLKDFDKLTRMVLVKLKDGCAYEHEPIRDFEILKDKYVKFSTYKGDDKYLKYMIDCVKKAKPNEEDIEDDELKSLRLVCFYRHRLDINLNRITVSIELEFKERTLMDIHGYECRSNTRVTNYRKDKKYLHIGVREIKAMLRKGLEEDFKAIKREQGLVNPDAVRDFITKAFAFRLSPSLMFSTDKETLYFYPPVKRDRRIDFYGALLRVKSEVVN